MLRAPRGKVLVRVDEPEISADAQGAYAKGDGVILLPETYVTRDEAQVGTVVSVGDAADSRSYKPNQNERVLFNKWSAREIDDHDVVIRASDIYATDDCHPCRCVNDVCLICPLPPDNERTAAGIFLPEVYRLQREQGLDPDTQQILQVGFGRMVDTGAAWGWAPTWVLFEYRHAAYHPIVVTDGDGDEFAVDHVFVHDDGHTILAVVDHATVEREVGKRATGIAGYRYRHSVTARRQRP